MLYVVGAFLCTWETNRENLRTLYLRHRPANRTGTAAAAPCSRPRKGLLCRSTLGQALPAQITLLSFSAFWFHQYTPSITLHPALNTIVIASWIRGHPLYLRPLDTTFPHHPSSLLPSAQYSLSHSLSFPHPLPPPQASPGLREGWEAR